MDKNDLKCYRQMWSRERACRWEKPIVSPGSRPHVQTEGCWVSFMNSNMVRRAGEVLRAF